ncbi:hypothetical protein LTR70_010662 [Exophiala xenobiotica]|uniref:THO complex subunit 1 transcription elongation factor-domain-containing protein n=1 Tax=Lithohypha guttulata TaxID=1690604 RepID=A0ABR0JUY4_9EURO|nr:hypothetical protein LTR24_010600 [Lithohypha guttulata]KAK5309032.1 hypothetical protein LTR70_010662 [Exophiala xenobiotica]
MSITKIPLVSTYRQVAEAATRSEAGQILEQVRSVRANNAEPGPAHSLAIDTSFRELFVELIASLDIENDDFSPVWSLFDSINLLCDNELCESALGFWLVEDLLDSQTIHGCREVFNYLESRRERMTKVNFAQKHLPVLRCCNELLRRLSRAEDTVFCGRVFIYLFQSFPLGDKSSVNLRGEFHLENVTAYDEIQPKLDHVDDSMDLDGQDKREQADLHHLYPVFWSLQSLFSSPTKLFEVDSMQQFKDGMNKTMACFTNVAQNTATAAATAQDPDKKGLKRKRGDINKNHTELNASAFNPKYLTNRDLFDLELHDIDFRRHILVQALILLDFLLSLSAQGKAKLSNIKEKKGTMSALYDKYTLSEEDRTWVLDTRKDIERYLEEGNGTEGRYYLRMVNMVLSRDRNWAFWKAEGCPPISREPVEPSIEQESQSSLQKISSSANAPLPRPAGAGQLEFLSNSEPIEALKKKRPHIPTLEDYYKSIQTDELDLDFATEEEKKEIEERTAGKLWRALRSARGKRFALCEEIKNGENLDALIGKVKGEDKQGQEQDQEQVQQQQDMQDQDHDQEQTGAVAIEVEAEEVKQEA